MFAAKHFNLQLGIDAHSYSAPPGAWPTVHIGTVFDPFDYLPTINVSPDNPVLKAVGGALGAVDNAMQSGLDMIGEGTRAPEIPPPPPLLGVEEAAPAEPPKTIPIPLGATVEVGGVRRANAGTAGLDFHIPIGAPTPPPKSPIGMQFEDELFMGRRTVLADGEPFSFLGMPVLACNLAGMIPPIRLKKSAKGIPLSPVLPTTYNVATPINVFVGGVPTISWATMLSRTFLKALGKAYKAVARRVFKKMEPGFLKCTILHAEPVDIRDGSVSVEHLDFEIPGRLPLTWVRNYSSTNEHTGACGHGWDTPADLRLELSADGSVSFFGPYQVALFPHLPADDAGDGDYVLDLFDGARLLREPVHWVVRTKDGLRYVFARDTQASTGAPVRPGVLSLIEQIEDACGNRWHFERRGGRLLRIVESGVADLPGRVIEVQSSREGLIEALALIDPATGARHPLVSYRYAQGDLDAAVDALGAARRFAYVEHRMVRHTDRVGLSFYYAYDPQWRVVHAWGDGGLYDYHFVYDEVLRQTEVTNSLGHTTVVKFDENRLPLCEIDPLGGVTVFEYDDAGRTVAVTAPEGLRTRFDYDSRGNLLSVMRADGSVVCNEYDEEDRVVTMVDPGGHRWSRSSDARGLPVSQTDPLGATTHFEHDVYGQLVRHVNPRGAVTLLAYDRYGQLESLTDPLGHVSRFTHDVRGHLRERIDALGRNTRCYLDVKGRLLRVEQHDGTAVRITYDAEDRLIRHADEAGRETRLEYVGIDQIGRRIEADGSAVQYHYDTEEQLVGVSNERGERYTLVHDALGRLVEEIDYWGQSSRYQYDAVGRLSGRIDPLGRCVSYRTDPLGRITTKILPDPAQPGQKTQEHFEYDRAGRLVSMHNPHRDVRRRFDPAGRLIEEIQGEFRIAYRYDEAGNRIERSTSAGHTVAYAYDLRGQVSAITLDDSAPIVIQRDALGRAMREQLNDKIERRFAYDLRDQLNAQTVLGEAGPLFDTRYNYDRTGNLTARRDSHQGSDQYQYNALGRILEHTDPQGRIRAYLYDSAGDRMRTRIRQSPARKAANGGDVPAQWLREGRCEGIDYMYDRAGNLVRRAPAGDVPGKTLHLRWDANQRLIRSEHGGKTATIYGYDPLGRRVFKRNDSHTTWFYWDGDALVAETVCANDTDDAYEATTLSTATTPSQNVLRFGPRQRTTKTLTQSILEYVYYPGTFVPLALLSHRGNEEQAGVYCGVYYYHVDPNGCATKLTNTFGQVVWSASYEAWGKADAIHVQKIENSLRYQGQYFDEETQLHYNRYRYYDPSSGQFIGQDPIGLNGGINLYQYAPNILAWSDACGLSCGIENKFPDEALPDDGRIVPFRIEGGLIKGVGGQRFFDFVVDMNGNLIIGNKHHLLGNAGTVLAAGQIRLNGRGQIRHIDNRSGHYRPTVEEGLNFPQILRDAGLDLGGATLNLDRVTINSDGFVTSRVREISRVLQ